MPMIQWKPSWRRPGDGTRFAATGGGPPPGFADATPRPPRDGRRPRPLVRVIGTRMPAPLSTYRVQMHAGFGFDKAASIAGYLRELGVTHLYSSPYLQAGKGSTHGYDV